MRKMQEHEVESLEFFERLVIQGFSFRIARSYTLCSDGRGGAFGNNPVRYLAYERSYWDNVKPQTPQMVEDSRKFLIKYLNDIEKDL